MYHQSTSYKTPPTQPPWLNVGRCPQQVVSQSPHRRGKSNRPDGMWRPARPRRLGMEIRREERNGGEQIDGQWWFINQVDLYGLKIIYGMKMVDFD